MNAMDSAAPVRPNAAFMLRHPARWIALGFGSGLAPKAPGTVGTLWAWVAFLALSRWFDAAAWAWVIAASLPIGLWACTRTAQQLRLADPGAIVWDEIVAFWIVLWLLLPASFGWQLAAFALFRYFDAAKPGPVGRRRPPVQAQARRSDRLASGLRHLVRRPGGGGLHAAGAGTGHAAVDMSDLMGLEPKVLQLAALLRARGWRLATAESCTGGLIAAACTAVAGSSDWFERGFVTYSNDAKTQLVGVPAALIAADGAVSERVARAMAQGALEHAPVQIAVAVTGIAGPGGAVPGKPVGTVWLACATAQGVQAERLQLGGDRSAVRNATVHAALQRLIATAAA